MNMYSSCKRTLCLLLAAVLLAGALSACAAQGGGGDPSAPEPVAWEPDTSRYLVAIEDEPDTVDFQCTTIHYTIAQNVFDRLVEMENDADGNAVILPSLAESWEISADRCRYAFHLREGVTFSNGSALTASDVLYTFTRLLTHPDSCNRDIADNIVGAHRLEAGETDNLEGFEVLGELDFAITLERPFEAFLACLSMPGASILDAETTEAAGDRFGTDPDWTVGTGSFILRSWEPGRGMLLSANPNCWQGAPRCAGLDLRFMTGPEEIRLLFESGGLDILNLDDVGKSSEFFLHGDIYQDRLYHVQRISITYIALNESVRPLNNARVRQALQLGLNRAVLLDAAYGGRGLLENGIMPHGLYGFNPDLPDIPFAPEDARALLAEAGGGLSQRLRPHVQRQLRVVFERDGADPGGGLHVGGARRARDRRGPARQRVHASAQERFPLVLFGHLDRGLQRPGQFLLYLLRRRGEHALSQPLLSARGDHGAGAPCPHDRGPRGAHPGIPRAGKDHRPGGRGVDPAVLQTVLLCMLNAA